MQQTVALPFDGLHALLQFVGRLAGQVAAHAENHGERRTELVGDIGEEALAHLCEAFQSQVVAAVNALHVEEHHQCAYQYHHNDGEYYGVDVSCRTLALEVHIGFVHHTCLMVALYEQTRILYAVELLHVDDAVSHGGSILVCRQRRIVVARALV